MILRGCIRRWPDKPPAITRLALGGRMHSVSYKRTCSTSSGRTRNLLSMPSHREFVRDRSSAVFPDQVLDPVGISVQTGCSASRTATPYRAFMRRGVSGYPLPDFARVLLLPTEARARARARAMRRSARQDFLSWERVPRLAPLSSPSVPESRCNVCIMHGSIRDRCYDIFRDRTRR